MLQVAHFARNSACGGSKFPLKTALYLGCLHDSTVVIAPSPGFPCVNLMVEISGQEYLAKCHSNFLHV